MARPIPRNLNWRPDNPARPARRRERHYAPARDLPHHSDFRLLFGFVKLGLFVLGGIAVVILLGALLIQFIRATMPMSLMALAFMGFITWLIIKNS